MSSTQDPWFGATLGLIGVIAGFTIATTFNSSSAPTPIQAAGNASIPAQPSAPAPTGTAPEIGIGPVKGDADATITLVEFTDFDCPFCARHFTQVYPQIIKDYVDTGKVKYEMRNLPLTGLHPNAQQAAEAAMCAHEQGKYWEMHDQLFAQASARTSVADPLTTYKQYASEIGLNAAEFDTCMANDDTVQAIQADASAGSAAGVDGTPGFWVIGPDGQTQQIVGAYPYDTFKAAFDSMLH